MMTCSLPVLTCQFSLISFDNDQLRVILIPTISDADGANIVCIISLPTALAADVLVLVLTALAALEWFDIWIIIIRIGSATISVL